jgi:hypothetical protein
MIAYVEGLLTANGIEKALQPVMDFVLELLAWELFAVTPQELVLISNGEIIPTPQVWNLIVDLSSIHSVDGLIAYAADALTKEFGIIVNGDTLAVTIDGKEDEVVFEVDKDGVVSADTIQFQSGIFNLVQINYEGGKFVLIFDCGLALQFVLETIA